MAINTTTLAAACGLNDKFVSLTSATGCAAGVTILVDQEQMEVTKDYVSGTLPNVLRGQDGTIQQAHVVSANAVLGLPSDFAAPGAGSAGVTYPTALRTRDFRSYSAAGAITLPSGGRDMVAVINGTGALAMTLANPTTDIDGSILWIVANGKAAHTVTYTAGLGNGGASFDVGTFSASLQEACGLMACNGFWLLCASGICNANTPVGGPTWA